MKSILRRLIRFIIVLSVCRNAIATKSKSDEPTYKYEPAVSELIGVLGTHVYPGPPNWESIKSGDRPERIWRVRLKNPITLLGDPDSTSQNEKETGVKEIQVIVEDDKLEDRMRKHVGATILFKGTLTHAITGHHHLPILMEVQSFTIEGK